MTEVHAPQVATQSALFTTPIPLASLEAQDQICPICHEPYIEPPHSNCTHDSDQEWPVSMDMVAERLGIKRCCGHILGRRCLEKLLQACGEWRNKCPMCRDTWYGHSTVNNAAPSEGLQASAQRDFRAPRIPRRSSRLASRATRQRQALGSQMSARNEVRRFRPFEPVRVRPLRSTGSIHQLLDALNVEHGSDQVKGTLEEVERRLETLYGDGTEG